MESELQDEGGNIYDLKEMLRHSAVKMTERYHHMDPNHLTGKNDVLDFGSPSKRHYAKVISLQDR
ncbi:MAG: hypothetical protein AB8G05_05640 [Oligoflexales bacterium]